MTVRTETFSYLQPLSDEEVADQVAYLLRQGYIPGIEFSERVDPKDTYWNFWKLPFFKQPTVDDVLAELDACRRANPKAYIRLTGYDGKRQSQVLSFVVARPTAAS